MSNVPHPRPYGYAVLRTDYVPGWLARQSVAVTP